MVRMNFVKREDVTYATVAERLAAFAIDSLLLSILAFIVSKIFFLATGYGIILFLFANIIFPYFERSRWQASIGKQLLCLKVVDFSGGKIGFLQTLFRSIIKAMILFLSHFLLLRVYIEQASDTPLILFVLWFLFVVICIGSLLYSKQNQPLYDRATGVFIIKIEGRTLTKT
ncbi:RDD family protein [Caldibacillus lycopersici]|uniref:RDD family protein n=1 Tax=Perspicuibacillus lycopersici TaxID=1325689 RepID=A0AAE3LTT5_9BACI|nr:RDD family protein [Perspicuibacillus lycopersici]MCU9614488.1 RDD family protein [Perspicuibacillus lycopersici]